MKTLATCVVELALLGVAFLFGQHVGHQEQYKHDQAQLQRIVGDTAP